MTVDIPTMLMMVVAGSVAMAAAIALIGWGQRRDGLERWAVALLLHALGHGLYALRGRAPDWASIILANTLLSFAFALMAAALHQFFRRPTPRGLKLAPLGLLTLIAAMVVMQATYNQRVAVVNLFFAVQMAGIVWPLCVPWRGHWGRGALVVGAGLVLTMTVLLGRVVVATTTAGIDEHLLSTTATQTLTFLGSFISVLGTTLGFLSMSKERSDRRNHRLASEDALTGTANRRAILDALEHEAERSRRGELPLSVLMLDLDHFKQVNDHHGHQVGDQVLRHVIDVARQALRAQDLIGRYGGEEFLIVLPDTPPEGARVLAERLRQRVAQSPWTNGPTPIPVTISIGVGGSTDARAGGQALIQQADAALYCAKARGRNRVEALPPTPAAPALHVLATEDTM